MPRGNLQKEKVACKVEKQRKALSKQGFP
jgi:hypothetical protein